ncbi:MAG: hypothetical protein AVDCRST_MAG32-2409, partial [uncultured Nocardioides sp.]
WGSWRAAPGCPGRAAGGTSWATVPSPRSSPLIGRSRSPSPARTSRARSSRSRRCAGSPWSSTSGGPPAIRASSSSPSSTAWPSRWGTGSPSSGSTSATRASRTRRPSSAARTCRTPPSTPRTGARSWPSPQGWGPGRSPPPWCSTPRAGSRRSSRAPSRPSRPWCRCSRGSWMS